MTDTEKRYECAWHRRAGEAERERDEARMEALDCGQRGVCRTPPGCARHWEERNRELVRENDVLRSNSDHISSENAALSSQVDSMAMRIESLAEELAKPEDVRLRDVLDALEGRAVIFDGLGARVGHLLDEMDEWIGRAGEAERERDEARAALEAERATHADAVKQMEQLKREREAARTFATGTIDALRNAGYQMGSRPPGEKIDQLAAERDSLRTQLSDLENKLVDRTATLTLERDDLRQSLTLATAGLELADRREREVVKERDVLRAQLDAANAELGTQHADCPHMLEAASLAASNLELEERLARVVEGAKGTRAKLAAVKAERDGMGALVQTVREAREYLANLSYDPVVAQMLHKLRALDAAPAAVKTQTKGGDAHAAARTRSDVLPDSCARVEVAQPGADSTSAPGAASWPDEADALLEIIAGSSLVNCDDTTLGILGAEHACSETNHPREHWCEGCDILDRINRLRDRRDAVEPDTAEPKPPEQPGPICMWCGARGHLGLDCAQRGGVPASDVADFRATGAVAPWERAPVPPATDPHAGCVAAALEAASEAWERSGVEPFGQTLRELAAELRRGG